MGTMATKDTRRISFDNKFELNSAIAVPKSIEDVGLFDFENITPETSGDLIFTDSNKCMETQEETEVDYWAHRIDNLKKEHQDINKIIEVEYEKQIKVTNEEFEPPKITHERLQKIRPCFEWRTKIVQCYEENPHQPLVCSSAVQAFNKCVTSCRVEDKLGCSSFH